MSAPKDSLSSSGDSGGKIPKPSSSNVGGGLGVLLKSSGGKSDRDKSPHRLSPRGKRDTSEKTFSMRSPRNVSRYATTSALDDNNSFRSESEIHSLAAEGPLEKLKTLITSQNVNSKDSHGASTLHLAVSNDRKEVVEYLLQAGADAQAVDDEGNTPVALAALSGNTDIFNLLLHFNGSVTIADNSGELPLHKAAFHGHKQIVQATIRAGTLAEAADREGVNALQLAAYNGHSHVIQFLLENSTNLKGAGHSPRASSSFVNQADLRGSSALHKAAHQGHMKACEILLDYKASPHAVDMSKNTPLHAAASGGHTDIAKLLISRGAVVNSLAARDISPLHLAALKGRSELCSLLVDAGARVNQKDRSGATALHNACLCGDLATVQVLLNAGADAVDNHPEDFTCDDDDDIDLCTPLHYAAYSGQKQIVELLLQKGAQVDAKDIELATPLHHAAYKGKAEVVEVLLKHGAAHSSTDNAGLTPLFKATVRGKKDAAMALMRAGAAGSSDLAAGPLVAAVQKGHEELALILGARVNNQVFLEFEDNRGNTLLHLALLRNPQLSLIKWLMMKGLESAIKKANKKGDAPLHLAIRTRDLNVISYLIEKGADVNQRDGKEKLPLQRAKKRGDEAVCKLLQSKGATDASRPGSAPLRSSGSGSGGLPTTTSGKNKDLAAGIRKFNSSKPSHVIEQLLAEKFIANDSPAEISRFLYEASSAQSGGLHRDKLGDFLGHKDRVEVLKAFVDRIDFTNLELDEALRVFLGRFRLPGEAQVIDRFMVQFASRYCALNPAVFKHEDTAYILAFSLIMLNTDAHNPNVKKKMSKDHFVRNNKGINGGSDLPTELLEKLYQNIVTNEIKMDGQQMFSKAEKKGWLTKQGGRVKSWKKRWFVLNDNCLYYFKKEKDTEPLGIVPLEDLAVRVIDKDPSKFAFELYHTTSQDAMKACKMNSAGAVVRSHHDTYLLRAETHEERKEWIHALENNILSNPLTELVNKRKKHQAAVGSSGGTGGSSPGTNSGNSSANNTLRSSGGNRTPSPRGSASPFRGAQLAPTPAPPPVTSSPPVNFQELASLLAQCQAAAKSGYHTFREKYPNTVTLLISHGCWCFVQTDFAAKSHTIVMHVTPTEPAKDIRPLMLLCRTSAQLLAGSNFKLEEHLNLHKALPEQLNRLRGILYPNFAIVMTGHSLGGVAALRFAVYLTQAGYRITRLVTFGQPRFIVDQTLLLAASDLPLLRVIDGRDVVHYAYPLAVHIGSELTLLVENAYHYSERPRDRELRSAQLEPNALSIALAAHSLESFAKKLASKLSCSTRAVSDADVDKMIAAEPAEPVAPAAAIGTKRDKIDKR